MANKTDCIVTVDQETGEAAAGFTACCGATGNSLRGNQSLFQFVFRYIYIRSTFFGSNSVFQVLDIISCLVFKSEIKQKQTFGFRREGKSCVWYSNTKDAVLLEDVFLSRLEVSEVVKTISITSPELLRSRSSSQSAKFTLTRAATEGSDMFTLSGVV